MGALLSYSLVGGLFMLALYLAYRVFLARDNQHGFNRAVLLMIYAVAFLMPVVISMAGRLKGGSVVASVVENISVGNIEVVSANAPHHGQSIWWTILLLVYTIGMVAVLLKSIAVWVKLSGIIRKGDRIRHGGYTVVITDSEKYAPFSWLNYIVVSRADYQNNFDAIVAHELKHVASRHWVDLLVAQIVCIIDWFNPAAWLMRDELMLVHEYQADMAVIDSGNDPQAYQMLLIKKAVGSRFPSLANSLNHSKLKKRITMMYKSKSGAGHKLKALALVPTLVLAIGVVSIPAVRAAVSTIGSSTISVDKGNENSATLQAVDEVNSPTAPAASTEAPAKVFSNPEVLPQYPGGEQAMIQAVMSELNYTEASKKEGASGRAVIRFKINTNGEMLDFEVLKSSGYGDLDAEAIRAIKEGLKEKWTPGSIDGRPVSVTYCMPVTFTLE